MTPSCPGALSRPLLHLSLRLLLLPLSVGLLTSACSVAAPTAATADTRSETTTVVADAGDYQPQRGQAGKDVVWVPTPDDVVTRMLQMAGVSSRDLVVDLGSGDGKIAIAAALQHGARARGLEYNPDMVALSQRRAQQAGVTDRVRFIEADIFKSDFSDATVVTMYLLPGLNLRLRETLFGMKPGTRIVSHSFDMGEWEADEKAFIGSAVVFYWTIPANASGSWMLSAPRLEGAPRSLRFEQRFQRLSGQADFGGLNASAMEPRLEGARISFSLRDQRGAMLRFEGTVDGARISGRVSRDGGAAVPFEARREGEAGTIAGLQHSDFEARLMGTGI